MKTYLKSFTFVCLIWLGLSSFNDIQTPMLKGTFVQEDGTTAIVELNSSSAEEWNGELKDIKILLDGNELLLKSAQFVHAPHEGNAVLHVVKSQGNLVDVINKVKNRTPIGQHDVIILDYLKLNGIPEDKFIEPVVITIK